MKRKDAFKVNKDNLKKKNCNWNHFLKITKIIEINDICNKNNNLSKNPIKRESVIKEEVFNQIITKKLIK